MKKYIIVLFVIFGSLLGCFVFEGFKPDSNSSVYMPSNKLEKSRDATQGRPHKRETTTSSFDEKMLKLSISDQAIYRARGYLKSNEIDSKIHTKVGKNHYVEKIVIDEELARKILAEVERQGSEYDNNIVVNESVKRYNLENIIIDIAQKGEVKFQNYMEELGKIFGQNDMPYSIISKAVQEINQYESSEKQKELAKAWSLKISLKQPVDSVIEAHQRCIKKSPIS